MAYTPPAYNAINSDLGSGYTPPVYNAINADLAVPSGEPLSVRSTLDQFYNLVEPSRSFLDQNYCLLFEILSALEQQWGNSIRSNLFQFYNDQPFVRSYLIQIFGTSPLTRSSFTQKYDDAKLIRSSFSQEYKLLDYLVSICVQKYFISDTEVRSQFDQEFDLLSVDYCRSSLDSVYSLISGDTKSNSISTDPPYVPSIPWTLGDPYNDPNPWTPGDEIRIQALINNKIIDFIGFSIQASMGSYLITCTLTLPSESEYRKCQYMDYAIITVNDTVFFLFVEDRSRNVVAGEETFSVTIVSLTAKLDSPYFTPIVQSFPSGIMAKQLVMDMAGLGGFSVDWQLIDYRISDSTELDWFLPSEAISINDETPLTVIKKIVNAVGANVQTSPDNTIIILSEYPIAVPNWSSATPVITFGIDNEIESIQDNFEIRLGYNAFEISNQSSSDENITLEVYDVDTTTKKVRGFRIPFDDGEFPLATSGGSTVLIDKKTTPVILDIPEIDPDDTDPEEWEIVEFIDWTGSVSLPMYALIDFDWIDDDLGLFTWTEDGTLTIADQSLVPSESLLRIKYKTKYWEWTVSGRVNIPIQFYVPEL